MEHREWGRDMSQEEENLVANSLLKEDIGMTVSRKDVQLPFEGVKKKDIASREKTIKQFGGKLIREIDRAQIFDEQLEGLSIETVKAKLEKRAEQLNYQYNSKLASHDFYHLDVEDSEGELKELIVVNDFLGQIQMMKDTSFDFRTGGSDSKKLARTPSGLN
jgi:hypothetical protein